MDKNLDDVTLDVLQMRLIDELEVQGRLRQELTSALESEKNLRLENDVLWAYLQRKHPGRVKDARGLLHRLTEGSNLSTELHDPAAGAPPEKFTLRQRIRRGIGKLPGVHRLYHSIKNRDR